MKKELKFEEIREVFFGELFNEDTGDDAKMVPSRKFDEGPSIKFDVGPSRKFDSSPSRAASVSYDGLVSNIQFFANRTGSIELADGTLIEYDEESRKVEISRGSGK